MKTTNLILLLSFVLMGVTSFSQSSINHHEYFNTSTPNEYFLSQDASLTADKKKVLVCGVITEHLVNFTEFDLDFASYLIKTDLNGNIIFNKRYTQVEEPQNILFDQVHESQNGSIYVAGSTLARQYPGILKLDGTNGNIISQKFNDGTPYQELRGFSFRFVKILEYNSNLYLIGYAKYAYSYGTATNFAHKTFIMQYDYNLNLLDYRVFSIIPPNPIGSASEEETVASDAIIHTNTATLNDEIVIIGEGQNLINTMGSAYNHDALFLLRIDLATLNPINLNFYPQVVSMSPFAVEGSYAASICELGADKFMIGGFYELFLQHFGLSIIELDESGAYLSNNSMYLPNLPNSFTPDPFLNRPTSIHADYLDKEAIITVFGDIQFNGFYSSLKNHNKYAWENRSFLLNYNYSQSRVINLKNFKPISKGLDSNYATKMLHLDTDNFILVGDNFAPTYSPSSTSTLAGTTYFINDIHNDMSSCMKNIERSDEYNVDYSRISVVPGTWQPFNIPINCTIDVSDNNDKEICTEPIAVGDELKQKTNYTVQITNPLSTEVLATYTLNLNTNNFTKYSAWDIPIEILSSLDDKTLYLLELVNSKTQEKRIFKFSK